MYFPPRFTLLLYFLLYLCDVEPFFIVQQGNLPSNRGGHFYARSRHSYMAVPAPPWGVLMHLQILAVGLVFDNGTGRDCSFSFFTSPMNRIIHLLKLNDLWKTTLSR